MVANSLIAEHRQAILDLARRHGAKEVRVFGSAARGETGPESDVDFLVELEPEATLIDLGALLMDLQDLLGRKVDLVTPRGLHESVREAVLREAVAL